MTRIFSDAFLNEDPHAISDAIRKDGFFCMEKAVSDEWIESLLADVARHPAAINKNWVGGVFAEGQYYLTHMLACSRAFYHYVTHAKLRSVCDDMLGDQYRLKAMRYYETYGHHHMQWHTDNKTDRGFAHIPGLIFIVYLADVAEGEFQYVRGSQNWSGDKAYSDYSDDFIEREHGADVVSFKGPRGTVVIYDTYGIHRARPVFKSGFVRKSLFFQVDSKIDSAEPLLLNPSFVPPDDMADKRLLAYFGFGKPAEYSVFPDTDYKTVPLLRVRWARVAHWLCYRPLRAGYDMLPAEFKNAVRAVTGRKPL